MENEIEIQPPASELVPAPQQRRIIIEETTEPQSLEVQAEQQSTKTVLGVLTIVVLIIIAIGAIWMLRHSSNTKVKPPELKP
jgi:hypothetical protein